MARIYFKDVQQVAGYLAEELVKFGMEKAPEDGGPVWKLDQGSPTYGNAWRLRYTKGDDTGLWGPDFLQSSGYLGWSGAEAYEAIQRVRATLHYVNDRLS